MVTFSIVSLFPEQVRDALRHSITGRALQEGRVDLRAVQIRDFAVNDYGQVDDAPYGGGRGMLMMCEPVYRAWKKARDDLSTAAESAASPDGTPSEEAPERDDPPPVRTLYLSPKGRCFDQKMALELSKTPHLIFLCGHYEGVDQRVLDEIGAEEVSIGDYVLTGGELAAAVIIDAVTRLLPGVLPDEEAWQRESFAGDLLEEPQYTRPASWRGLDVPEVFLSGHAANIEKARQAMRLLETLKKRPDLLEGKAVDREVIEELGETLSGR